VLRSASPTGFDHDLSYRNIDGALPPVGDVAVVHARNVPGAHLAGEGSRPRLALRIAGNEGRDVELHGVVPPFAVLRRTSRWSRSSSVIRWLISLSFFDRRKALVIETFITLAISFGVANSISLRSISSLIIACSLLHRLFIL
jgi:hypothetical protein